MKRIILPLAVTLFVFLAIAFIIFNQEKLAKKSVSNQKVHSTLFFESHNFYQGVNSVKDFDLSFDQKIRGGIVPHHLLAGEILSDFFARLSKQAPEAVILVGPNHKAKGKNILTSAWDWETPFGAVEAESHIIEDLIGKGFADEDNEIVGNEHSVGGMMSYLAYYLPDTRVIPIVLSSSTSLSAVQKLGDYLAETMKDQNVVIIAAVDFAHEVTSEEAEVNDTVTEGLIRKFDLSTLFSLNNKYLDSAPAVGVLLQVMQGLGAKTVEVLNHTNSSFLLGGQPSLVTSYFEMIFYKAVIPHLLTGNKKKEVLDIMQQRSILE